MKDAVEDRLQLNFEHKRPTWTIQGEAAKVIEGLRWDIDSRDRTIRKLKDRLKENSQ